MWVIVYTPLILQTVVILDEYILALYVQKHFVTKVVNTVRAHLHS